MQLEPIGSGWAAPGGRRPEQPAARGPNRGRRVSESRSQGPAPSPRPCGSLTPPPAPVSPTGARGRGAHGVPRPGAAPLRGPRCRVAAPGAAGPARLGSGGAALTSRDDGRLQRFHGDSRTPRRPSRPPSVPGRDFRLRSHGRSTSGPLGAGPWGRRGRGPGGAGGGASRGLGQARRCPRGSHGCGALGPGDASVSRPRPRKACVRAAPAGRRRAEVRT